MAAPAGVFFLAAAAAAAAANPAGAVAQVIPPPVFGSEDELAATIQHRLQLGENLREVADWLGMGHNTDYRRLHRWVQRRGGIQRGVEVTDAQLVHLCSAIVLTNWRI
eukprot:gene1800-154_t